VTMRSTAGGSSQIEDDQSEGDKGPPRNAGSDQASAARWAAPKTDPQRPLEQAKANEAMKTHPIPDAALDDRLAFVGTSGSGKTHAACTGVERLLSKRARAVVADPLDVWYGLRLKQDGERAAFPVVIFGGAKGDLPVTEAAGGLIGETVASMAESCVVSLAGLGSKAAERRFMLAFLERLYRRATGEPFHVVFARLEGDQSSRGCGRAAGLRSRLRSGRAHRSRGGTLRGRSVCETAEHGNRCRTVAAEAPGSSCNDPLPAAGDSATTETGASAGAGHPERLGRAIRPRSAPCWPRWRGGRSWASTGRAGPWRVRSRVGG